MNILHYLKALLSTAVSNEYTANADVKLYKYPGTLFRDTLRKGERVVSTNSRDGWLQIDAPARFASFWGEAKYFTPVSVEPPLPPSAVLTHEIDVYDDGKIAVDGGEPF